MMAMVRISVTDDYRPLIGFFIENDLEFEEGEEYGDDEIVRCWRADAEPDGGLVGACVLAKRDGRFICDGIATDASVRGMGLGRELFELLIEEVRARGGREIYLVARAPGFYRKFGFAEVPREEAPAVVECFACPQYGVSCHPEVMRLELGE
ncbi:MAG: GNAT family N-acetyltransferase [Clostridiales Family XIII bacterium]|jgi:N-acetylglutamate synthase-like GNAT family acetyltransferase|nr:GNAT family N-acetyltransferase [Clostridiales Family XIII bacterium]